MAKKKKKKHCWQTKVCSFMSSLLFIVLLRENKVLVLLWQAYYLSRSGSLLVNMDYWILADLLFLLLWLSGWWGDGSFDLKRCCWQWLCRLVSWSCWY